MFKKITETVYVTKYALTAGIKTFHDGEIAKGGYFYTATGYHSFKFGTDAFYSRDDAEQDAKDRAARKLESLDKQRAKILPLLNTPKWAKAARKLESLDKQRAKILPLLNTPKWAKAD